jgi:hydrogenase maturation protease
MNHRTLVVGYGNAYCHDDGVALYIINELRRRSGIRELQPDEDGMDELSHDVDSVMLHQLVPEVAPLAADYRLIVFVDAHVGTIPDDVRVVPVEEEHRFHAVTHHMSPGMLLSLTKEEKGVAPRAFLISVKGENFDFGLGLSDQCRRCADLAVRKILDLMDGSA